MVEFKNAKINSEFSCGKADDPRPSKIAPSGQNLNDVWFDVTSAHVMQDLKKYDSFKILAPVLVPSLIPFFISSPKFLYSIG
jgi:hypothetical protein